ncbi:membrane protein insertase YidC [bacterium]|nr:membrane protein insertase YidC [bacterium]
MEQEDQRNFLIALVLMGVMMFAYYNFVIGPQEQAQRAQRAAQIEASQQAAASGPATLPAPTLERSQIVGTDAASGRRIAIDAERVDGTILLTGARLDDLRLRQHFETVDDKIANNRDKEVQLLTPDATGEGFHVVVNWTGASALPDEFSNWTQTSTGPLTETNPLTLSFERDGVKVERRIEIDADYMFTVSDTVTNNGGAPITIQPVAAIRQAVLPGLLKAEPNARTGVFGVYGPSTFETLSYKRLSEGKGVAQSTTGGWIGLTTKYWMAAVIPDQTDPVSFSASMRQTAAGGLFLAGYTGAQRTLAPGETTTEVNHVFAGAKRVATLERYKNELGIPRFDDAVDWGIFWFLTKPLFWLLSLFQGWFGNFALALLAVTVVVKTLFFPIQFKAYEAMSKMRKLAPEMKAIQERFAADKQRQQQEIMKMYQREKANPLSGCLPLVPQMFVFYALYKTLIVTLEMRHTPFFGWIRDMSAPDPTTIFNLFGLLPFNPGAIPVIGAFLMIGVWPLLYGATMWALQGLSPPPTDPTQKAIMQWLPVIFLFLFATFASGLVIYWVWSNVITIAQQYIIMRRQGVETEFDKFLKKRLGGKTEAET